jgi:hypothetical protein
LEYVNLPKQVKFWAGLDINPENVCFMLWFDDNNLGNCILKAGGPIPNRSEQVITSGNQKRMTRWVALNDIDFKLFCDNPHTSLSILEDFITDVLKVI